VSVELIDKFLEIDELKVRFWDCGSGEPLLLLHGLGASIETWAHNIEDLSRKHRVVAIDLPGAGRSSRPSSYEAYSLTYAGEFIFRFLDQLGIWHVDLIGNSLGGALATHFCLQYPKAVRSLILVDSAGLGREIGSLYKCCAIRPVGEILIWPTRLHVESFARTLLYRQELVTDDFVDKMLRHFKMTGTKESILTILRKGVSPKGQRVTFDAETLNKINVPTLVIWGTQDSLLPLAHAKNALDGIPDCRVVALEHAGHAPQMDRPEVFNEIVSEFLEKGSLSIEQTERRPFLFSL
jgi:pimeloyl-ACP methyl ester carboxylesterase